MRLDERDENAVRTIRQIRNCVLAHSESGELTKEEYKEKRNKLCNVVVNDLRFMNEEEFKQIEEIDIGNTDELSYGYDKNLFEEISDLKERMKKIESRSTPQREVNHDAEKTEIESIPEEVVSNDAEKTETESIPQEAVINDAEKTESESMQQKRAKGKSNSKFCILV